MGKSSKKGKNERINALRKQYDAFLEEDKKRRDRNEYILEKLDKMRASTSLVPISHKVHIPLLLDTHSHINRRPEKSRSNTINYGTASSDLVSPCIDESPFLNEIRKKYILIPKIRTLIKTNETYCLEPSEDFDWKSKYNILNDLKKQEKEDQSHNIFLTAHKDIDASVDNNQSQKIVANNDTDSSASNAQTQNIDKPDKINEDTEKQKDKLSQIGPKTSGGDITDVKTSQINHYTHDENNYISSQKNISPPHDVLVSRYDGTKENKNCDIQEIGQLYQENLVENEKGHSDHVGKYIDNKINLNCTEENKIYNKAMKENIQNVNYKEMPPVETVEIPTYENGPESIDAAIKEQVISNVLPQEKTEESLQNNIIFHENTESPKDDLAYNEHLQHYEDAPHPESHNEDQTIHEVEQHYDPTHENIPGVLEKTEHVDNVTEINAFEAEQKEMFYSEETDINYAHNEGEVSNEAYPTEGYDQNGQYNYYEGVQQEQVYATDINEHEESQERYDPNYNQQYDTSFDNQQTEHMVNYDNQQSENVNEYDQQQYHDGNYENVTENTVNYDNQQLENVVNYDNQIENPIYHQDNVANENNVEENVLMPQQSDNQIYDQHVYEEQSDSQQHIEQQLDTEEGYIAPVENHDMGLMKNTEDNEPENVLDVTSPVELVPEPKVT